MRIFVRYITPNTATTIRLFVNSDETFRMIEVYALKQFTDKFKVPEQQVTFKTVRENALDTCR